MAYCPHMHAYLKNPLSQDQKTFCATFSGSIFKTKKIHCIFLSFKYAFHLVTKYLNIFSGHYSDKKIHTGNNFHELNIGTFCKINFPACMQANQKIFPNKYTKLKINL